MSSMYNTNDIKILCSIVDKDTQRGLSLGKGTTVEQLQKKTKFSVPKIRRTIKKLKEDGLIADGIRIVSHKSYYVTDDGIKKMDELTLISKYGEDLLRELNEEDDNNGC